MCQHKWRCRFTQWEWRAPLHWEKKGRPPAVGEGSTLQELLRCYWTEAWKAQWGLANGITWGKDAQKQGTAGTKAQKRPGIFGLLWVSSLAQRQKQTAEAGKRHRIKKGKRKRANFTAGSRKTHMKVQILTPGQPIKPDKLRLSCGQIDINYPKTQALI